MIGQNIAIG
ncbi:hypothetical protein D030_4911A, partial [Vibrio parahaemolyticus AQ3810]